jgi:hypothetical protein
MIRLALLLTGLLALPALAQRLDQPMAIAPVAPLQTLQGGTVAPLPNRGVPQPGSPQSRDLPRIEPTMLGTRDSASANTLPPASPGLLEDRLLRTPAPALRLTVPLSE